MRKLLLSIALLCSLTAWAQTTYPQTYAPTDFTTDEAHAKIEKCPTDPNPSLTTSNAGDRYTWYKYNETTGLYENPTTSSGQTIPSRSVGKYMCVIEKDVTGANRNLLTVGDFDFQCNDMTRYDGEDGIYEEDGIIYRFKRLICNADDTTYPGGFTCIKDKSSNVKPTYFAYVQSDADPAVGYDHTNILVCDGMNSPDFNVWQAEKVKITAGISYEFSCYVANIDKEFALHGMNSIPKLRFFVKTGTTITPLTDFTAPSTVGTWKQFTATYRATTTGECTIYIQNYTTEDQGNDFAIDNIYFGEPQNGTQYTYETFEIAEKNCSSTSTESKSYTPCTNTTCQLAPVSTGTAVWKDANGNTITDINIDITDETVLTYTCIVTTTDASGNPLTITETHTITPQVCTSTDNKEYNPCAGSNEVLTAINTGTGYSYRWSTNETTESIVIPNASNQTYTCEVTIPRTPNNLVITETHALVTRNCFITKTDSVCLNTDLTLSPANQGDEYTWTLTQNGVETAVIPNADGTLTINHSTVTPQDQPLIYTCIVMNKANTAGNLTLDNNLISNGDFEDTNMANGSFTGFYSGYDYNTAFLPNKTNGLPYAGYYRLATAGTTSVNPEPGIGGNAFLECDGHSDPNKSGDVYVAPVTQPIVQGYKYQFAYSAVATCHSNYPKLTFTIVGFDENNNQIGTPQVLLAEKEINNTTWQQFGVGEYWTAPATYHHAEIRLINSVLQAGGNDFGLDNILFQRAYTGTSTIDQLVMKEEFKIKVKKCTEEKEWDDEFLIGSTVTIHPETIGGTSWEWYHKDGTPVTDQVGNHLGAESITIVIQDPENAPDINNYYCVIEMPDGTTITETITLSLYEPVALNPCQFDEVTLTPTLTGSNENWYRLLTFNDLTQKEVLTGVVGDENKVNCQDLVEFLNFETGLNQISLVRTITDENGTARDEQWNLTIDPCQETKAPVVKAICQGESYTWNNTSYTATTEKTNVYREKRENRYWEITESLNLTVNPNPSFQVEVDGRTANIITQSNFDFITLDNQSTLTDTKYTWLSIGDHTITMTDNNGCSSTQAFSIVAEPIDPEVFFTPNDDGNNDTWDIDNLEYYPDAIIQIYDRYSRLLSSIKGIDFAGWDGYYNGHIMPMDDYWYVILIPDNNTKVSGHFILKR